MSIEWTPFKFVGGPFDGMTKNLNVHVLPGDYMTLRYNERLKGTYEVKDRDGLGVVWAWYVGVEPPRSPWWKFWENRKTVVEAKG